MLALHQQKQLVAGFARALPRHLGAPTHLPHSSTGATHQQQPLVRFEPHTCRASAQMVEQTSVTQSSSQGKHVKWTHLGTNSWMAEFPKSGVTVLCDPWLTGELTFAGQNWVFEGKKGLDKPLDIDALAAKADFILLSQGLPDHAHEPTLKALPKHLPVVASPAGARVAASCGFKQVFELDHNQSLDMCEGKLHIKATIGALVGPPWDHRENGFLLKENCNNGVNMYYEPHCDYDEKSLMDVGELDVLVTPAVNQLVTLYPLVQGGFNIQRLVGQLKPKLVIPLENANFPSTGPLTKLIWQQETNESLPARLEAAGIKGVRVEQCRPVGEAIDIRL